MKNHIRALSCLLICVLFLSACGGGLAATTGTSSSGDLSTQLAGTTTAYQPTTRATTAPTRLSTTAPTTITRPADSCQPSTAATNPSSAIIPSITTGTSTSASTTAPTNPTMKPTTAPATAAAPVYNYDPNRALPTLTEKFVAQDASGNLVLAKDGVAMAKIVVPANMPLKVEFASEDLQNYLKKITGATFEIITDEEMTGSGSYILLGATKKTLELGEGMFKAYPDDERYTIRVDGNYLILCGNDDGNFDCTQFAVTRFLEEAGCGWYGPSAVWQVVPNAPSLSVKPVNRDFVPRFESRNLSGVSGAMNPRWYLGGYSSSSGHGLPGWFGPDYYSSHPEYFALVNGSREPNTNDYWQYCYTNTNFAVAVANKIKEHFANATNANQVTISIAANDGWDKLWCECANCQNAGNHTDQMLRFANNVATLVCAQYPEKKLNILAYHSTFLPPEKTTYTHPNVEVMFCIETAPFVDLSKGEQIHSGKHYINQVVYTQSWKDSTQAYIDKANVQGVSIWAWYCIGGGRTEWRNYPWVQGNTISNNLYLWEQMGVKDIFVDCGNDPMDLRWPLYYALAKCMWEPELTAEQVLYEACVKLYGAAADEMFLYYRHLADAAAEHGGSNDSMVWVPPLVDQVYSHDANRIQAAMQAAVDKLPSLTLLEQTRVKSQANYWAKTAQNFGLDSTLN